MVNKKVNPTMIERWQNEINRRIYYEYKTNIIKDIAKREGLSYTAIYYWVQPEHYRENRRQYTKEYIKDHLEECRKKYREYATKHWRKQIDNQKDRYSDPKIRKHKLAQKRLFWKITHHIEGLLPEVIPTGNQPISIDEMVDTLRYTISGITVRYSTLEKSIKDYLAHNPHPIIKEVEQGKYIRI